MSAVTIATARHNADGTVTRGTITVDPAIGTLRQRAMPSEIPSADFFARFTSDEQLALATATQAPGQARVGLITFLAAPRVRLTSASLGTWLDALVAAGVINSGRKTTLLTP